jgi:hypothetical protein
MELLHHPRQPHPFVILVFSAFQNFHQVMNINQKKNVGTTESKDWGQFFDDFMIIV